MKKLPEIDSIRIAVNGINNLVSDDNWNNLAEIYFAGKRQLCHAFQYFSDTVFRRMFQQARVERLAALCKRYEKLGLGIILIVHSNGGDLVLRLLKIFKGYIREIHFIASASDHDCERNGLNEAIAAGRVGHVFFYCSRNDKALQKAMISKVLFGWAGLGYDYVGLVGPSNKEKYEANYTLVQNDKMDHSDWVLEENFDFTFKRVAA